MPDTYTTLEGLPSNVEAIADLAQQAVEIEKVHEEGSVVVFAVPEKVTLETLDLEQFLDAPTRKKGHVALHTAASLAQYVNAHKAPGTSLYADVERRSVVAVLDGHVPSEDTAGWGQHRTTLALRATPEWKAWTEHDGQYGDQIKFAEFIEDNLPDIVEPPAAVMLELAQNFQATGRVNFKSHRRLDSGQANLAYEETIDAKAGVKGDITIPTEFTIGIAPFEGADRYRVQARLRYRLRDGNLAIGYALVRPDDVLRAAFDELLGVVEAETELTALRGMAPSVP